MALLRSVSIRFDTHDDDKNDDTHRPRVRQEPPEQLPDSRSRTPTSSRTGSPSSGTRPSATSATVDRIRTSPTSWSSAHDDEFDDPSSHDHRARPGVAQTSASTRSSFRSRHPHARRPADDRWIFDYTVTLTFDNGAFSFTSTVDGVPRHHSRPGQPQPLGHRCREPAAHAADPRASQGRHRCGPQEGDARILDAQRQQGLRHAS